ncbi:sensor histidine kinase [Isoptericola hypogeus]|uniref:histidine kinase n=1 Tax=Isoptericola hypogeus TaxID=300179 RepID=A0ABN2JMP8_9MICO
MRRRPVARADATYRRVVSAWFADDAVGLRQLPVTVSVSAVLLFLAGSPVPNDAALLGASAAIVVVAQLVGSLGRWDRWPRAWQYALPLAQMLAIGLLELGSGYSLTAFDVLLVIPIVSLALQSGLWGVGIAFAGSAAVLFAPVLWADESAGRMPLTVHALMDLLVFAFVAAGAHGIVGLSRRQARQLERARDELAVGSRRLRDSRDTLRSILEAATEQAFVATDVDGTIVAVSTGAVRIFGRGEQGLVGHAVTDLLAPGTPEAGPPVDGSSLDALVGRAAAGDTEVHERECLLPDGSRRDLDVVVTRRPALAGATPELPPGYLFVATDVTARHEEQRTQDEFVGLVSHELRTPLSSILGYLDLMRLGDDRLDDEQREYLEVVERNARRLRSLVDDLLTSAQIVSGTYTLTAEEVDVVQVVRDAVASALPSERSAGVQVMVDGDASVPLISDPDRLGQVVDNLLSNAVKYTRGREDGHVRITVTSGAAADGSRLARLLVADDGSGISPDELGRVTERFYRSRDTRRRRVRGVGLGLALVDQIVHDHGGTMTIRSTLGQGTEVDVTLPDLTATTRPPGPPSARRSGGTAA